MALMTCCRRFRTHTGSDPYGHPFYAPGGGLLPHGALGWLLAVVIIYVFLHALTGHARHRLGGRRVTYGWSVLRGPWFSFRVSRHLRWRS